ncbi:hypothetical protein GMORB2_3900 [Geosmithia morbida]|uniref:Uncharacterized protein n=1 Tax=Geosmithia morbida TaxID=1094350 RepID=A0A9P4YXT8_9HYPO|nr:uncharacterized protein GMORB2_3900 [Geosmithia morbida]KAF4125061.1 hypothetical protein GMORB2_3900 [Geosmithia morbida]
MAPRIPTAASDSTLSVFGGRRSTRDGTGRARPSAGNMAGVHHAPGSAPAGTAAAAPPPQPLCAGLRHRDMVAQSVGSVRKHRDRGDGVAAGQATLRVLYADVKYEESGYGGPVQGAVHGYDRSCWPLPHAWSCAVCSRIGARARSRWRIVVLAGRVRLRRAYRLAYSHTSRSATDLDNDTSLYLEFPSHGCDAASAPACVGRDDPACRDA